VTAPSGSTSPPLDHNQPPAPVSTRSGMPSMRRPHHSTTPDLSRSPDVVGNRGDVTLAEPGHKGLASRPRVYNPGPSLWQERGVVMINVWFGALGRDAKSLTILDGTRLGDLVESEKLPPRVRFYVDRSSAALDTVLRDGEVVIAVPDAIVGGAADSVECAFCMRGPAFAVYWHRAYRKIGTRATIEPEGWCPVCRDCDTRVIKEGISYLRTIVLGGNLNRLLKAYPDETRMDENRRLNLRLDRMVRGFLSSCDGQRRELGRSSHKRIRLEITFRCIVSGGEEHRGIINEADQTYACLVCEQSVPVSPSHLHEAVAYTITVECAVSGSEEQAPLDDDVSFFCSGCEQKVLFSETDPSRGT